MAIWQVQEAKTKLSELIDRAQSDGPQTITKHGKPRAIVLSAEAYEEIRKRAKADEPNLIEFLLNSGPILDKIDLERDKGTGREIDLE